MNFVLLFFVSALFYNSCMGKNLPHEQQINTNHPQANPASDSSQLDTAKPKDSEAAVASDDNATAKKPDNEPRKNRCAQCNKRLVVPMKCYCEKEFCSKHRHAEAHNCSYDFKEAGQQKLAKENPPVVASKATSF